MSERSLYSMRTVILIDCGGYTTSSVLVQRCGTVTRRRQRSVGAAHVPAAAHTEAGAVHAGAEVPAGRHAEDDGQRRHVLRSSCSLHLHLQVGSPSLDALTTGAVQNVDSSEISRTHPERRSRFTRVESSPAFFSLSGEPFAKSKNDACTKACDGLNPNET